MGDPLIIHQMHTKLSIQKTYKTLLKTPIYIGLTNGLFSDVLQIVLLGKVRKVTIYPFNYAKDSY